MKIPYTKFAFREQALRTALQDYLDAHHPGMTLHEFVFSGMLEVKVVQARVPEPEKKRDVPKGKDKKHVD